MAQAHINDTALECVEDGRGEPLVLVHGSACDYRTWALQKALAAQFRVLRFSRRYHWPNKPIPEGADYSMDEQVDDLEAYVRSLEVGPAHLMGHSYGAFLCLLLALRAPSFVHSLVLAEPPVITLFVSDPPKPLELLKLLLTRPRTAVALFKLGALGIAPATRAFEQGDLEAGVRRFGDAVFGRRGYDRLPDAQKAQVRDNLTALQAELLGPGFRPLEADAVRQVKAPTLLVTGEKSLPLFHRLTDRLEELLPHAERIEIPGATHMMHGDNAPAYNAAVTAFLKRHRPATNR